MNVELIVDSTVDVPERVRSRLTVVPLTIHFGQEEFLDGVTMDRHRFYERLVESDVLPTTSQASPAAFDQELRRVRDSGSAAVVLPMCRDSLNRWGGAHGGILFALCDVAMGMAIMSLRQEVIVTVNAAIDYLSAAAADSTLTAVGKVDRLGGKLAFCSAEVTDENGKVIVQSRCVMSFTGRPLPLRGLIYGSAANCYGG